MAVTYLQNYDWLAFLSIMSRKRISAAAQRRLRENLPDLHALGIQLKKDTLRKGPPG